MGVIAKAETLRSLAFGSISGTYAAVGTGFIAPVSIIQLQNLTDTSMYFSMDGVNDHFILPTNSALVLDVTGNHAADDTGLYFAKGCIVYVKQVSAPSSGSVYVSTIYDAS